MGEGRACTCRGQSQSFRQPRSGWRIWSPIWERRSLLEGRRINELEQQRKPGPPRPKGGYQQELVPVLKNPQKRLGDHGKWGKGVEKGPGPLVAAQRTGTVHQGKPDGTVNRISGDKRSTSTLPKVAQMRSTTSG
ncbi:hypothetical protein XENOCAPTIV_018865 [Xenoophorus captivus]|uniref:Uncharacterized protein n=1 Tax=Xenoophorus captivus TaxID=1517983 RepID=A0ABV0RZG3_9TELE